MNAEAGLAQGMQMIETLKITAIEFLVKYGFQVLGGIIILFIGFKLSQWVGGVFIKFCQNRKLDITLTKFLAGLIKALIMVFVILMAMDKFGITISPLIATVSALIFGASFALQAPLSNYAAGLTVILTRPFVVGNTITVKGVSGVVEEVKLPNTILSTGDGDLITVPNKEIVGEILFNSAANKVVERIVGISYSDDPALAVKSVREALSRLSAVAKKPEPQIGIDSFGDSAINIGMRYWVPTREYYPSLYAANLAVYNALKAARVSIPFPQLEVRMQEAPQRT